jgi:hypothetical protein
MTPQKIYLAAAYERNDEMRGVRDVLTALGYEVTSRWIDPEAVAAEGAVGASDLKTEPERFARFAEMDLEDLRAADTVIHFTGGGRGGRHTEFGAAIILGLRLILVGEREHVFHALPAVEWYPDWSRLVMALSRSSRPCLR